MLRKIQKMLRNRKGFTLVELIVVVAILGILATVAVPKLIGFTDDAEDARDAANRKLVRDAAVLWLAENGAPASESTEEWTGAESEDWEDYLDEWPTGITKVEIDSSGNITVTP